MLTPAIQAKTSCSIPPPERECKVTMGGEVKEKQEDSVQAKMTVLLQRIWEVVAPVLELVIGWFLYWTNPSIFAISFIIGIVQDDKVTSAIKKIKDVWSAQFFNDWPDVRSIFGGVGLILSLPVTIAVGSIIYAANLGSTMSRRAHEILKMRVSSWDEALKKIPLAGIG